MTYPEPENIKPPRKKKILILNGSHSEIPLINAAKEEGFYVVTTGNARNLIGHQFADEYRFGDYSNLQEMLNLASELEIDAICASANDFGAITASFVSDKLGLPGHDNYETCLQLHQKHKFKEFAYLNSIKTPKAKSFNRQENALQGSDELSFPLMVKPVDLTGGKGISRVETQSQYVQAVKLAFELSREKKIVVEEFFEGSQHSFSTFIVNKKVKHYYSDNEFSYKNPYFVSSSTSPANKIEKFVEGLIAEAEKIASALNLVDGILHFQYLANDEDFTIIEATRRCSGDLYPLPVTNALGVDWSSLLLKAEAGISLSSLSPTLQTGFHGRCCIMAESNGVVSKVVIAPELQKYVTEEIIWWKEGDRVDNYFVDKLGVLVYSFPSLNIMQQITSNLEALIKVEVN